ncbi:MAG TPA: glycerophosphodiester phosphodiesterase family protein [Chloroflexota bacterium]
MDYLLVRRPYLLAHRGASGYAPENTMAAFERALALKADGLETDLRASKDGVLVLIHDERVDRTTDGEGLVADMTLEELRRLDAGGSYNPRFAGERIPTLDDLLERFGGRLPLCLEVKQPGIEAQLVAAARERGLLKPIPIVELRSRDQAALPPVSFSSFSFDTCRALKKEAPEALVGFLTTSFDDATIEWVAEAKLGQVCPRVDHCTSELVLKARDRGLSVRAWRVDDREVLRDAVDAGIDGLTCNWPDWTLTPTR